MEDAKKKGKEKLHSYSSSSAEPELNQGVVKRLKLTDPQTQTQSPIPYAQRMPVSTEQALAARLRLMTGNERAVFKGHRKANEGKQKSRAGVFWIPPRPSPLRPGPTPYERVTKIVKRVMDYLDLSKQSQPLPTPVTGRPPIVNVILMLDKYVEGISSSSSDEEMEIALREFQRKVCVDDEHISWYGLMKKSNFAFWNSLADIFIPKRRNSYFSDKRFARIRNPSSQPEPEPVKKKLLLPHRVTYLRPRPGPVESDPNDTQMGPPTPKINHATPYETVKKALTFLKSELGLPKFPNPKFSPWKILKKSCLSVEIVVMELDEYVDSISKTSSSDELKALLMLFQRRIGMPARPSFYNLLWFAPFDLLDHLGDNFLYDSISDDEGGDGDIG